MGERYFDYARKIDKETGELVVVDGKHVKAYEDAKLPVYGSRNAAGADFFCAETVVIPSIWGKFLKRLIPGTNMLERTENDNSQEWVKKDFAPTRVHTGIKCKMEEDEVLEIYTRSSMAKNFGLILANSVGVVDSDYFESKESDGEIQFAYINILPFDVEIKAGTKVGQGVFKKFLRPTKDLIVADEERSGGFGSTGK